MKTVSFTKQVERVRIAEELHAIVGVIRVRLKSADITSPFAESGVVECEDAVLDATVQAVIDAHDPTPPTLHEQSMAAFNDALVAARLVDRAIVLSAMDSDNVLRKFTRDLLAQIASATSLADLKTRCANNLPVLAALDGADARAAIGAKIEGGGAD